MTRYQTTCRHGGKPCPKVIQAIPIRSQSVHEATHRASCLPSLIVGAIVAGIAFLEGIVPAIVAALP